MSSLIPADATRIEYREIPWLLGYRFGFDGSAWSRRVRGRGDYLVDYWHRLRPTPNRDGYLVVRLGRGGPSKLYLLHRLITEAFHGPCPPGMEACHFPDRTRTNCRADNLRWGTSAENKADMAIHGTRARGERNGRAKLTEDAVREIRTLATRGERRVAIARRFGVDPKVIRGILSGRIWSHVG